MNSFGVQTCTLDGGDEFSDSRKLRYLLESKGMPMTIIDVNTEIKKATAQGGGASSTCIRESLIREHGLIKQGSTVTLP